MMGNSRSVAGVAIFRGIAEIMLNQRQTTAIGADKSGVCPKCLYGLFHNRHSRRLREVARPCGPEISPRPIAWRMFRGGNLTAQAIFSFYCYNFPVARNRNAMDGPDPRCNACLLWLMVY